MKYTTYFIGLMFLILYAIVQKPAPSFYLMINQNNLLASAKSLGLKKIKLLKTKHKFMIKIESLPCIMNSISVNFNDKMFWVSVVNNKVTRIEDYTDPNTKQDFTINSSSYIIPTKHDTLKSKHKTLQTKAEKIKKNTAIFFGVIKENIEHATANNLIEANNDLENRKTGIQALFIHHILSS